MQTSAMALNQLLSLAHKHGKSTTRVTRLIADELGLDQVGSEMFVISRLNSLTNQIHSDIEQTPFPADIKAQAVRHIQPFDGLRNLSVFHLNLDQAKSNYLNPNNLVGLMNLHMALSGHVEFSDISKDTKELADKFREELETVRNSDLTPYVKSIITKRVNQITAILDNYYAFDHEDLKSEIDALVGTLVVNRPSKKAKSVAIFTTIAALCGTALISLNKVDNAMGTATSILERGQNLIEIFNEDGKK